MEKNNLTESDYDVMLNTGLDPMKVEDIVFYLAEKLRYEIRSDFAEVKDTINKLINKLEDDQIF